MPIFNKTIIYPDQCVELGKKMSLASYTFEQAINTDYRSGDKNNAINKMQEAIFDLKSSATEKEPAFAFFIRKLFKLFGYVTNYQKVMNQINELEELGESLAENEKFLSTRSKRISKQLRTLDKEKEIDLIKISRELECIEQNFTQIEDAAKYLKKEAQNLSKIDSTYLNLQQTLSVYQSYLTDTQEMIDQLSDIYQGDIEGFDLIPSLWVRHKAVKSELQNVSSILTNLIKTCPDKKTPSPSINVGGINNGGNSCYLASAMQAINSTELYRDLFNPEKNLLKIRNGNPKESEASLNQRKLIQKNGFAILEKINKEITVSKEEINKFRQSCYDHKFDGCSRVIESERGQIDSVETLDHLLTVLDYDEPQLVFNYRMVFDDENNYEEVFPENPLNFQTLTDAKKDRSEAGTMTLSAMPHLNKAVTMNKLITEFWDGGTFEYIINYKSPETGEVTYRKYHDVKHEISLDLEKSNFPKVLRVTIQQLDGQRARVTNPEVIYPSGFEGVGPRYRLASVIEHRPGHYVAHIVTPNGFIEANDGWVHPDKNSSIPGYAYFYVLDDGQNAQ